MNVSPEAQRFFDHPTHDNPVREEMNSTQTGPNASRGRVYRATVPAAQPASDSTKRSGVTLFLICLEGDGMNQIRKWPCSNRQHRGEIVVPASSEHVGRTP